MPTAAKRALIDFAKRRREMVQHQVAARGVRSELVLEAMRKVPREEFLPSHLREFAYEDTPLPIAEGQTISQPYIVALMADALLLKGGERVLDIARCVDRINAVAKKWPMSRVPDRQCPPI